VNNPSKKPPNGRKAPFSTEEQRGRGMERPRRGRHVKETGVKKVFFLRLRKG